MIREYWQRSLSVVRSDGLMGKAVRSGGILTVGAVIENLLRFVRNMILARLLAPSAFGEMAIVLAGVSLMEAFSDVGLRENVIRNKQSSRPEFLNVVWWVAAGRGIALYGASYFAAPSIAAFYHNPDATILMRVGFAGILLNGFMSPRFYLLAKEFRFKEWVFLNQGAAAFAVVIGIGAAFVMRSVWALLLAYLIEWALRAFLSYVMCPFRPRIQFDRVCYREVMVFSRRIFGMPLLAVLFLQTDIFVIGKLLPSGMLGMYSLAQTLADVPNLFMAKAVLPVLLPTFSTIQDEKERIRDTVIRLNTVMAVFGIPALAFVVLFSRELLSLAYGPSYGVVAVPFGLLAGYSFILLFASTASQLYFALGRPDMHRSASLVRTLFFLFVIYPAVHLFGLAGAAGARVIAMLLLVVLLIAYFKKLTGIGYRDYFRSLLQGLKWVPVVLFPGLIIKEFFSLSTLLSLGIGAAFCIVACVLGAVGLAGGGAKAAGVPYQSDLELEQGR